MSIFCKESVLAAIAVVLISGCAAREIRSLNDELTQLSQSKDETRRQLREVKSAALQKENSDARDAAVSAHMRLLQLEDDLSQLMRQAYDAAGKASSDRAKISLYRVSVTAGWQAAIPEIEDAPPGTSSPAGPGNATIFRLAYEHGQARCVAVRAGNDAKLRNETARDCLILQLAPFLALNDQATRFANRGDASTAALRSKQALPRIQFSYTGFKAGLDQARQFPGYAALNPEFVAAMKGRQRDLACNLLEVWNTLASASLPNTPERDFSRTTRDSVIGTGAASECKDNATLINRQP